MRTVHSSLFKLIQFIRFNHVIQFVHASGRCHAMSLSFCTILFSSFHVMSFHPFHTIPFHSAAPLHSIPFHSPVQTKIPSFNHSANLVWLNLHSFQLNSIQTQSSDHWGLFSPVHSISVFLCSFILLSFSFEFHLQYLHVALCHSFIHSFIQSVSHSFIHTFIHSFIHSFVRSFVCSFIHSFGCRPGLPSHRHLAYCRCVATSLQRVWRTLTSKICPLIVCQVLCEKCHRPTTYPSHNPNRSLTPCTKFRPRHRHLSTTITNAATMKVKHQQTAIPCEALPNGLAADAQRSLC